MSSFFESELEKRVANAMQAVIRRSRTPKRSRDRDRSGRHSGTDRDSSRDRDRDRRRDRDRAKDRKSRDKDRRKDRRKERKKRRKATSSERSTASLESDSVSRTRHSPGDGGRGAAGDQGDGKGELTEAEQEVARLEAANSARTAATTPALPPASGQ